LCVRVRVCACVYLCDGVSLLIYMVWTFAVFYLHYCLWLGVLMHTHAFVRAQAFWIGLHLCVLNHAHTSIRSLMRHIGMHSQMMLLCHNTCACVHTLTHSYTYMHSLTQYNYTQTNTMHISQPLVSRQSMITLCNSLNNTLRMRLVEIVYLYTCRK